YIKVCGSYPLTFTTDDTLTAGNVSTNFISFSKLMKWIFDRWDCAKCSSHRKDLLFPQVSVIFRYSQLVSANHIDDTCKTFTSFYMCFLFFRLCFSCLKFNMNHNVFFIMTEIAITVCNTV